MAPPEIDLDRLERAFALDRDLRVELEALIRAFDESALRAFLRAFARELEGTRRPAQALVPALNCVARLEEV